MIGRASVVPLPADLQARLALPLSDVSKAIVGYMQSVAVALRAGAGSVDIGPVDVALQSYAAEVAVVRHEGLIRGLPGDAAERFFALGFSLDQMRQNLNDLNRLPRRLVSGCAGEGDRRAKLVEIRRRESRISRDRAARCRRSGP